MVVSRTLAALALAALSQPVQAQSLSDEEWRGDLDALVEAITTRHPAPFAYVDRPVFEQLVSDARAAIGTVGDAEMALNLARIVDSVGDGHTRLTLPVPLPQMQWRSSHSSDVTPRLAPLPQLPVGFDRVGADLVIGEAVAGQADLLGAKVLAIGGVAAGELLATGRDYAFGESESADLMLAADRIELLPVLGRAGVRPAPDGTVTLELVMPGGALRTVSLGATPREGQEVVRYLDRFAATALQLQNPDRTYWFAPVASTGDVYFHISQIANDPTHPLVEVMEEAVAQAERSGGRLVLDLRDNAGGNGFYNRALVGPILRSDHLMQLGQLLVLIGPRTFSAAQFVVNELERFARPVFVGEETGAHPSHYGDSRKTVLPASGLTLRVSSLAWSNWAGFNDERSSVAPHVAAAPDWRSFLAGSDPALEAALALPAAIDPLVLAERQFRAGRDYAGFVLLFNAMTQAGAERPSAAAIDALAKRLDSDGQRDSARFVYERTADFFPDNKLITAGLERTAPAK